MIESIDLKQPCIIFAKWIQDNLGIVYNENNFFQLEERIKSYCKENQISELHELERILRDPPFSHRQKLIDLAVNNETFFFREPKFFESLQESYLPSFLDLEGDRTLKIWSMACSLGQEVYSTAFAIEKFKKATGKNLKYEIIATDVSSRAIEKARNGIYSEAEVGRGLGQEDLATFFQPYEDGFRVNATIREKISFKLMNLYEEWTTPKNQDIAICRNVLYYMDRDKRAQVIMKAKGHLAPNGVYVLSGTENLLDFFDTYRPSERLYGSFKIKDPV